MTGYELLAGFIAVALALGFIIHRRSGEPLNEDIGFGFLLAGALTIYGFIVAVAFDWLVG